MLRASLFDTALYAEVEADTRATVWGSFILWATAPLLSLGSLLSVSLMTVWVLLGCPLLVQSVRCDRRRVASRHPAGRQRPIQQYREKHGRYSQGNHGAESHSALAPETPVTLSGNHDPG